MSTAYTDGQALAPTFVTLEKIDIFTLDEILAAEQHRPQLLLTDEAAQALRPDAEDSRRLDQVNVVVVRFVDHVLSAALLPPPEPWQTQGALAALLVTTARALHHAALNAPRRCGGGVSARR